MPEDKRKNKKEQKNNILNEDMFRVTGTKYYTDDEPLEPYKEENTWEEIKGRPDGLELNQIDKDGVVNRIDASTIKAGVITGTTLQTNVSGARVVVGGVGDEANDILMLDESTGGTSPITGNTASINFKRTDDETQVFKIQKRAGVNNDNENVFEMFYEKAANGSQDNYIFLGNKGDSNQTQALTDIIQLGAKKSVNVVLPNGYDSVAGSGLTTIQAANTDIYSGAGLNDGGTVIIMSANQADTDNGISDGGSIRFQIFDNGSITSGSVFMYVDKFGTYVAERTKSGITASTTQTQIGGTALEHTINEVSTVANIGDTVRLPSAATGIKVVVINNGANALKIFPASGDNLGAGVDTAMTTNLAAGDMITFHAYDATNWRGYRNTAVT